jgi:hypothetical protein
VKGVFMYFFSIKDIDFSERIRNLIAITGNYTVGTRIFDGIANVTVEDCLTQIGCDGQYHHVENSCGSYDLICRTDAPTLTAQDITCERDDPCSTAQLVAYGAVALAATTVTVCTLLYCYSRNSTKASDSNKATIEYDDFPIGSDEMQVDLTPSIGSSEMQPDSTPDVHSDLDLNANANVNLIPNIEHTENGKRALYWNGSRKGMRNYRFF